MYKHRYYVAASAPQMSFIKPKKEDLFDQFFGTSELPPSINRKLIKLWKKKRLMMGCDGSRKMDMGSFAFCFFDWINPSGPIITFATPLYGDYDQVTPMRSELL